MRQHKGELYETLHGHYWPALLDEMLCFKHGASIRKHRHLVKLFSLTANIIHTKSSFMLASIAKIRYTAVYRV